MRAYLEKKGVSLSPKIYFIDSLSYMALGLFSSLIIGLIIQTVGERMPLAFLSTHLIEMGDLLMNVLIWGGAIGVAVAYGLNAPPLVMFAALFSGALGAEAGGPAASFTAALISTELGKLISKETSLDIILTPLVTIVTGYTAGSLIGIPISAFLEGFGNIINWATVQEPVLMGILVSVLMGIALTAPISSLAISLMLSLEGVAAGAAAAGCAAQMISFAVLSYKDNTPGGIIAQAIGTSMLQIGNVIKKPVTMIPPVIAGAAVGPLATVVFTLENNAAGAGMGTSGFVGQIMTVETMGWSREVGIAILVTHFSVPIIVTIILGIWFRRKGWIKPGDLAIETS
ncbi:PTS transporter subunit IIC [Salimicrobium humidisoli]|uniref:PTS sugar transporter subunit IIC n=1 Tax=Salimicrobium humidisoli TaxID=2029857 RepID=A0ABX4HP96_9BACI|nr:PTS sugar transporter subunit IIC [Salimicrobium humidisoli]PBB05016.1 PTS sugar transporter subunit IIC [Salimicrobium humidisoli]